MKWIKRIFISLALIGVICIGGLFIYNEAYTKAYVLGDAEGYEAGKTIGYISGKQDGYKEGEEAGYYSGKADGYAQGESVGYISGRRDGYSEGEAIGYEDGYSEGKTDGYDEGLGHGYTLRDPTYEEAVAFLREDKTDENKYVEDTYGVYVCTHFARDVCNNAEEEELRCAFVVLRYPDGTCHTIIAFNTIDKGLVYFTPQTDERVKPVVGKRYYQCIEPKPGYYYPKPAHDDTIMDILLIW